MESASERRGATRHTLYLGAKLDCPTTGERNALTMDISEDGLSLLTRAPLEDGDRITVRVYMPDRSEPISVVGTVVRHKPLEPDESNLWREKVAVSFEQAQSALANEFARHAARQSAVFAKQR